MEFRAERQRYIAVRVDGLSVEVPCLCELHEREASRVRAYVPRVMCGVADGVSCARRDVERAQLAVAELDKALVVALSPVAALHRQAARAYRIIEGLSARIAEVENGGLFGAVWGGGFPRFRGRGGRYI